MRVCHCTLAGTKACDTCPNVLAADTVPQPVYTQLGTTTIDLDAMRAEIAALRAENAAMREALEQIASMKIRSCSVAIHTCGDAVNVARFALPRRAAPKEEP